MESCIRISLSEYKDPDQSQRFDHSGRNEIWREPFPMRRRNCFWSAAACRTSRRPRPRPRLLPVLRYATKAFLTLHSLLVDQVVNRGRPARRGCPAAGPAGQ